MGKLHQFKVLEAWYKEFLTINGYRPRTIGDYTFEVSFFRRWLDENGNIEDIDELSPQILHEYAASLYNRQLAARSIHHKLAALCNFFTAAYQEKKLYTDMRKHINLPRLSKELPAGVLNETETQQILDYLAAKTANLQVQSLRDAVLVRDGAVFEVLYSTGMRRDEIKGLRLGDIDYDDGLVFIHDGKGGKDRVVPMGKKALEVVRRYVTEARPVFGADCDCLFVTRKGSALGDYTIRQAVISVTKGAGIKRHVKVHTIRHTCATHMLNSGADIRYVQELLGHASLSSTQVYTHVSINKLKETHRKHHPREKEE